jgi:hypothetical protein
MTRTVANSLFALTIAVGLAPTAASADGSVLRWIPGLKQFYDFADAGRKIVTGDLPSVFSDSFDLQDTERRARNYHPRADAIEAPKIDGARVLSRDREVRTRARDEYADFVASEGGRIANLEAHRDRIAAQLSQMERRFESGREMMSRLPDLIEKSSRIPIVNEVMPTDLEAAQLAGDENLRTLAGAIEEYRRIVNEFDRLINAARALHDAHIQTLRTIDVLHGVVPATGAQIGSQPRPDPPTAAATDGPRITSLSSRIGDAVSAVAGPSIGRAAGLSNSLIPMRQRAAAMAPHGSGGVGLSPAGGNTGPSERPEWIGVMTLQP